MTPQKGGASAKGSDSAVPAPSKPNAGGSSDMSSIAAMAAARAQRSKKKAPTESKDQGSAAPHSGAAKSKAEASTASSSSRDTVPPAPKITRRNSFTSPTKSPKKPSLPRTPSEPNLRGRGGLLAAIQQAGAASIKANQERDGGWTPEKQSTPEPNGLWGAVATKVTGRRGALQDTPNRDGSSSDESD